MAGYRPTMRLAATRSSLASLGLALAISVLLSLAGSARAAGAFVYCVSDPACPAGGIAQSGVQAAFNAADALGSSSSATVDIGPGTFIAAGSFLDSSGNAGANPISVVGAGEGSTILTTTASGGNVLDFSSGANSDENASASNLTVDMANANLGVYGAQHLTNVVISGGGRSGATAVWGGGDALSNVTINMPLATNSHGIYQANGLLTANKLTITADVAATADGSDDTFTDVRVHADSAGLLLSGSNGSLGTASTLTQSEIVMSGNGDALAWSQDASFNQGTLDASFLTIVGDNTSGSKGVATDAVSTGNGVVDLSNSIVQGFAAPIACTDGGGSSAGVVATYSDFNSAADSEACTGLIQRSNDINENPDLVALADGDEPAAYNSPAIDAGDPSITGPLSDLLGNPRPVDGGTGHDYVDMGAFEYQHVAPTAIAGASPGSVAIGTPVTFSSAGSLDVNPGDALAYSWSFDDGTTATGASVTHAFSTPGTHDATLTVTAPDGLNATAVASVTVASATVVAPSVTAAAFAPERFRAKAGKPRHGASSPLGSTLDFTLNQPATVAITIELAAPGREHDKSCVAPSKRAKGARCVRYVTLGSLPSVAGTQGNDTVSFDGRLNGKPLKPGNYRAVLTATTSTGGTSAPTDAGFNIVKH